MARRLIISLIKQRLIFDRAWSKVHSKFFTRLLQRSIQAFKRSNTHRVATGTNPDLPRAFFSAFEGLGELTKAFGRNAGITSILTAWESIRIRVVHFGFFLLVRALEHAG